VFNTSSLKDTSEKLVAQKIDAATEIFVEIVKTPLLVNDLATLDDAASNFTAITSIAAVQVLGTSGDVLSERINQSGIFDSEEAQEKLTEFMGDANFASGSDTGILGRDFIRFSRIVSIDEEKLGEIRFVYDISDSIQTVKKSASVTYALAAAALLISTLIAVVLGYRITRQLNSLTETANEIAHDNPVVIPTYQYSGDEINRLFGAMKTMQQKIVDRTQEMTAARSRALVASKAKSEFLAVMSHEIRTPLNGMIGSLNLMDQKKLTDEDAEHLDTVRKSSTLLTTIINDILDLSNFIVQ